MYYIWQSSEIYSGYSPNFAMKIMHNTTFKSKLWVTGPARNWSVKLWKKTVKYCYFFSDSKLTELTQNDQNTAISKHFTKSAEDTDTTSGTIFSADVWISGRQVIFFLITNLAHTPSEAFASKQKIIKWNK